MRSLWSKTLLVIATTIASLTSGPFAAGAASRSVAFRVRLPGYFFVGARTRESVHGNAVARIPTSWVQLRSTDGGTVGHLKARLARGCDASIEVRPGIEATDEAPAKQITDAMDFWFEPGIPLPPPIPRVTLHVSNRRAWSLGTPPPEYQPAPRGTPAAGTASPYYGVALERVARPNRWAWVNVSVRTPVSCWQHLPNRPAFESALETILRTATFNVTLGRVVSSPVGRAAD